jgi:hypothetical protein
MESWFESRQGKNSSDGIWDPPSAIYNVERRLFLKAKAAGALSCPFTSI